MLGRWSYCQHWDVASESKHQVLLHCDWKCSSPRILLLLYHLHHHHHLLSIWFVDFKSSPLQQPASGYISSLGVCLFFCGQVSLSRKHGTEIFPEESLNVQAKKRWLLLIYSLDRCLVKKKKKKKPLLESNPCCIIF